MNALRILGAALLVLGSPLAGAGDSGQPQSIMFEQDRTTDHLTTVPPKADAGGQDRCAELAAQLEALKGKPQRRYAVAQQYEAECRR